MDLVSGGVDAADIGGTAVRLRVGEVTSHRLTEQALQAARAHESLNAFITLAPSAALAEAAERDRELARGHDRGPLHGIPVVQKDLFNTRGLRTTAGTRALEGHAPEVDATVVRRVRAAGAVLLGKTNMSELAAGLSGHNVGFGDVRNPVDSTRVAGGSSGGTAAVVGAGVCLAGTGSDTGGSVRAPAAYCGVVGLRTTWGLVDLEGALSRAPSLDTAGPIARSVPDAAVLLTAMAGDRAADYVGGLRLGVDGVRVGVVDDWSIAGADPDVIEQVARTVDVLAGQGAVVVQVRCDALASRAAEARMLQMLLYEFRQAFIAAFGPDVDHGRFGPDVRADLAGAHHVSQEDYAEALRHRAAYTAALREVFDDVDVLVGPTVPSVAPMLDDGVAEFDRSRRWLVPASYAGLPAISVPGGPGRAGMPVGVQLVGPALAEGLLLRVAHVVASESGVPTPNQPI